MIGTMMSRHDVLVALGPGATMDIADRAILLMEHRDGLWKQAAERVMEAVELGGLHEVAELLGRDRATVGHWIAGRRGPGNFPEPWVTLKATPVWDLAAVREWSQTVLKTSQGAL